MSKKSHIKKNFVAEIITLLLIIAFSSPVTGNSFNNQILNDQKTLFTKSSFNRDILYVGGNGGNNYSNIQDAINNASDGDEIFVYSHSSPYNENIVIDKSIKLIGEDKNTTKILGDSTSEAVNILADEVEISGFAIQNIYDWSVGVVLLSNSNVIKDNNISDNGCAIRIENSNNNVISRNIVSNNTYGMYTYSDSNDNILTYNDISNNEYGIIFIYSINFTISNNVIYNNKYGIHLHSTTNDTIFNNDIFDNNRGIVICGSKYDYIYGNNIFQNDYGLYSYCSSDNNFITINIVTLNYYGIYLDFYSNNNYLKSNNVSNNNEGIYLGYKCHDNIVKDNKLLENDYGIILNNAGGENTIDENNIKNSDYGIHLSFYSNSNTIKRNTVYNNIKGITIRDYCNQNLLYHNDFVNNTQNAYDECNNKWNNDYPCGGNYWKDHKLTFVEKESDGLGKTPYNITGGNNQDSFPLLGPHNTYYILDVHSDSQIDENIDFIITVKSMGGSFIPDAHVEFKGEVKVTDINGEVKFRAPWVDNDTIFWVNATKEGYIKDSEKVTVKDVPRPKLAFIVGKFSNLQNIGGYILLEAENIRYVTFLPINFVHYESGEIITTSEYYFGVISQDFILALTLIYLLE